MGAHIVNGQFQSDKYPTCPAGKVPLSVKDATCQDLLWEYAQRRRAVDAEFSGDLETMLVAAGFEPMLRPDGKGGIQLKDGTPVPVTRITLGITADLAEALRVAQKALKEAYDHVRTSSDEVCLSAIDGALSVARVALAKYRKSHG